MRSASTAGEAGVGDSSWAERFVSCAAGVMTDVVLSSPQVQGCLLEVMLDAAETGRIWEMQAELEEQISKTPALFAACHDIGHKAGRRAYELTPDIGRMITENDSVTCAYGLGHGVLDGFADDFPSREDFAAAASACSSKEGASAGLCADGIGHAAWSAARDLGTAVSYCDLIPYESGRAACSEGIVMQIYEPAGFLPSEDLARGMKELPEVCSSWPSTDGDTVMGCHTGAGYIYTREAWKMEGMVRNGHGDRGSLQDGIVEVLVAAAELCQRHGSLKGVSDCFGSVAIQVPHSLYESEDALSRACAPLAGSEDLCLNWKHIVS